MVAVTIAATFFYIKQDPRILRKLQREIRTVFGSETPENGPKLDSCTYLRACVDEALRMAPPGPGVFWRTSSSHHVIDGISLPVGIEFGVCIYAMHYNNAIFDEPETYRPERMMKQESEASNAKEGLLPFLRGFRACPAQKLAYAAILLPVARLLWEFELRLNKPVSASEMASDVLTGSSEALASVRIRRTEAPHPVTPQHAKVFPQVDVFGSHITGPVISFSRSGA